MNYLSLLIYLVVLSQHMVSAQTADTTETSSKVFTDGFAEYWEPTDEELFKIFKRKYWRANRINHFYAVTEHVLLVRLRRTHPRIAPLERTGKTNAADKLRNQIKENNEAYVKTIKEEYPGKEYYFYYAEDAKEVFQGNTLKNLYSDLETRAPDREIETIAYVLSDQAVVLHKEYGMNLFIFDQKSVLKRVSKNDLQRYTNPLSAKISPSKSVKNFIKKINKQLK